MFENQWWSEEYGFFGEYYLKGDNSKEGYLSVEKQTLKKRTAVEVAGIVRLLNLKDKASILDIPCGYGRHSIELAKLGYIVTGSELNIIHLAKARKTAKKRGAKVHFVKENMINIQYNEKFDAVINIFYSFGFFKTDRENKKVLINFYRALKDGGKFLMHTDVNMECIRNGKYKFNEKRSLQNGETLRIMDRYNPKTKRIEGSWVIVNKVKNYSVRVYEVGEFVSMCKDVGFKTVDVYSNWDGSPYNKESEMLIFVATK